MLKVLKPFREGGKEYRPGDDAPAGLHPDKREQLIRMRHLYDPKAKTTPRPERVLHVSPNDRPNHIEWRDVDGDGVAETATLVPDQYETVAAAPVKYGSDIVTSRAVRH